jgi:hypothetical protein
MLYRVLLVGSLACTSAFMAPVVRASRSKVTMGGPGSGDHGEGGRSKFGGEATRDPEPTAYDPNDPKGKQQAIHKADSFAEYLAKRGAGGGAAAAPAPPPAAAGAGGFPDIDALFDGIWGIDAKTAVFNVWDPESPRTYTNFNPFERNDEAAMCDVNGCFPGQSRGYKVPNRPDTSWAIMQAEAAEMDKLKADPKFSVTGKPGNFNRKWQDSLGAPP